MTFAKLLSILLLLALVTTTASAFEAGRGDHWQLSLSGFGTLGGVYSTNADAGYLRDVTQRHGARGFSYDTDSRLGLQANIKLFDKIELVGQGVTRYRYDNTYTPELTMSFAKIEPLDGLTIRGGAFAGGRVHEHRIT